MTTPPTIAPETQALLDAVVPPDGALTSPSTETMYTLVQPIHDVVSVAHARISAVEILRRKADAAENDPNVFALFERIKQTNSAILRIATEASDALDRLTDAMLQLDDVGNQTKRSVDGCASRM